ncbi:MAG: flagellar export chaperone FlgN [Actinotalea sp.]|nr:flagellar export chaperone FlgN [Actinotalea sp.]
MGLNELSEVLWHERRALELLLFRVDTQRLALAGGSTRWLGRTTCEIEAGVDRVRSVELALAVEAQDVALSLGLEADASLRDVADSAPAPWDDLLADHHRELVHLTDQLRAVTAHTRELLVRSHRAVDEALTALEDELLEEPDLDGTGLVEDTWPTHEAGPADDARPADHALRPTDHAGPAERLRGPMLPGPGDGHVALRHVDQAM